MRSFQNFEQDLPTQPEHPLKAKIIKHFCGRESNFQSEAPITLESARAMHTEPEKDRFLSTLKHGENDIKIEGLDLS
ncbi:MAG: hypothetical protein ACK521_07530 [bacterium]